MDRRKCLIAWLNDAYAMEQGLIPILKNHAKDADEHPDVRARIEMHIEETRSQAERLKSCLELLGEKPSAMKSGMASFFGALQAPMTGMSSDELVKNCLTDYATENFEIACYRALILAAQELGEPAIAETCTAILAEEQQMADWLAQQLPTAVGEHLAKAAA